MIADSMKCGVLAFFNVRNCVSRFSKEINAPVRECKVMASRPGLHPAHNKHVSTYSQ